MATISEKKFKQRNVQVHTAIGVFALKMKKNLFEESGSYLTLLTHTTHRSLHGIIM